MSKICQITGKKSMNGNKISHSNRKTKRIFNVNLFSKKVYWTDQNCWIKLLVSAHGLRIINKIGINNAIRKAIKKGYLNI